jgi:hypothetical protein
MASKNKRRYFRPTITLWTDLLTGLGAIGLFFVLIVGDWSVIKANSAWIIGAYVFALALLFFRVESKKKVTNEKRNAVYNLLGGRSLPCRIPFHRSGLLFPFLGFDPWGR